MRKENSDPTLAAISRALRPLPYWMGYKRERYGRYPLPEMAIGAELRELLHASAPPGWAVKCEEPLVSIGGLRGKHENSKSALGRPRSIDLAITKVKDGQYVAAIELKRASGPTAALLKDLTRLADLSKSKANAILRCFAVLFCESSRPREFVTPRGLANRAWRINCGPEHIAKVRRVFRVHGNATLITASKKESGSRRLAAQHWVILLEIVSK